MSNQLIDDYPILVLPKLAEKIGLNEAIILQQIHYWLKDSKHKFDNKNWIYNSFTEWQKQFPFWSVITIKRTIYSLEKKNLLYVGNYNNAKFDKTKWYSINYQCLEDMIRPSYQNDTTSVSKRDDGTGQNDTTNTRDYTETSSETTSHNSTTDVTQVQFNEWWNLYDKKLDKKKAFSLFKSALKKHKFETIMNGTKAYLKTINNKQYQKYPKTFLSQESFLNDYSAEIEKITNQYTEAFERAAQPIDIEDIPF
ncbi:replication protein [Staphylococcus haemolyticus]|uniref:replication protein n=1 Tax=Staphylococcus haemolyticus TaxID=1283 RepID=UPI000B1E1AAC|nr:replication protein [Staphylococcus haemolyticus]MCH4326199.1 replication protein [Staphylococcus haemolyticus]MCH4414276.1 replication protein [Staphylococcus haemolyticus]MCH4419086.1 replication protein [Staphylococcus haemolyticus]MCH4456592.1 replication protein [Staphylococcus haemolyticus]MCH4489746.1 replication protein [Staphylococcus haemolyticus]